MELEKMLPYDLELLIEKAQELLHQKESSNLTHHEFIEANYQLSKCPFCGCEHIVKNGHHKGVQHFKCKDCMKTFGLTNNTFLYHAQQPYGNWIRFIQGEMKHMTLKAQAEELNVSIPTCFAMRHKLYEAVSAKRESVQLQGEIQTDFTYKGINLKGTRPRQDAKNQ